MLRFWLLFCIWWNLNGWLHTNNEVSLKIAAIKSDKSESYES